MHKVLVNRWSTDRPHMTIAVDWDVKQQTKPKKVISRIINMSIEERKIFTMYFQHFSFYEQWKFHHLEFIFITLRVFVSRISLENFKGLCGIQICYCSRTSTNLIFLYDLFFV